MNYLLRHNPHPCQPLLNSHLRPYRKPFLISLALAGFLLACVSCSETRSSSPPPPPAPVTDTAPVGEGLKVIGFAMLGAAVVVVLGKMIR